MGGIRWENRTFCKNGHLITPETTYIYKTSHWCRICKTVQSKRCVRHRDPVKRRISHNRAVRRAYDKKCQIVNLAKATPCLDCGIQYPPYIMDFDHVRGKKLMNVGEMKNRSESMLRDEIAKCEVVCANCHREREHKRSLLNASNRARR